MLLLDVERAFDRIWHEGLLKKMIDMQFPRYLIKMVQSFLVGRQFQVCVKGVKSIPHLISFGVPQGAVLSPMLYNIYTSDAPTNITCHRAFFADDTAFFVSSNLRAPILQKLRDTFTTYLQYYKKWKITININKTQAMFFTRRHTREIPRRPMRVSGNSIPWSTEPIKYLGILFDKRMTFRQHTDHVIHKAEAVVKMIYPLICRKSRLSINNKILLYKTVIRPIISYACPVFHDAATIHIKKLQIFQNKLLRMCLDAPFMTRISQLHDTAKIETIYDHFQKLKSNYSNN